MSSTCPILALINLYHSSPKLLTTNSVLLKYATTHVTADRGTAHELRPRLFPILLSNLSTPEWFHSTLAHSVLFHFVLNRIYKLILVTVTLNYLDFTVFTRLLRDFYPSHWLMSNSIYSTTVSPAGVVSKCSRTTLRWNKRVLCLTSRRRLRYPQPPLRSRPTSLISDSMSSQPVASIIESNPFISQSNLSVRPPSANCPILSNDLQLPLLQRSVFRMSLTEWTHTSFTISSSNVVFTSALDQLSLSWILRKSISQWLMCPEWYKTGFR